MKPLGKFDCRAIEEEILKWWETEKIYAAIKKAEPKDKVWRFIDGPPYTTGDVHLGTAWNKILKDYLIKYKRMQGFRVTDTPGYDTHGLPIEVIIEKKLGIKNKSDIQSFGLDNFIKECRNFAESKIGTMNEQFIRLGCAFWNWDNPYITYMNTYIQGIWWTLKEAWKRGYLYKFYKPQNCCPRCATALAKHEFEYKTIPDNAIYVKFKSVDEPKTYFLIWTTTPWTLVSNTNIMVNPNNEYVKMRVKDEYWIMGMAATSDLLQNKLNLSLNTPDGFEYGDRFTGRDLEGRRYIHPLAKEVPIHAELEKKQPKVHTIVLSDKYVKEGEGVGMVHTAPGHGPEDFEVGVENGIPVFSPVDEKGCYTAEGGQFQGKFVHTTNQEIMDLLKKKGTLICIDQIEHEYAHCWRCHSKLVYRATEQWFFKTSALSQKMLEENEQIFWVPKGAGSINFRSWLASLQDWCISRQRFWGIPLSIWECDQDKCKNLDVIGSIAELKEKAVDVPEDIHKPWIDTVTWTCPKCKKGVMRRIPDVLDVWLDSGSVMWSSQFFVDGKEHYDSWVPADFILEGKDQIRGWFNSLLCSAMVSSERKNYNACYMHGWVMSHSVKMSKSLGNAITPKDVIDGGLEMLSEEEKEALRIAAANEKTSKFDKALEKSKDSTDKNASKKSSKKPAKGTNQAEHKLLRDDPRFSNIKGIETFRFYSVMGTPPGRDLNFDTKEYADTFKVLNTLWNSYLFAQEKWQLNEFDPKTHQLVFESLDPTHKWILSRTNHLIKDLTALFDTYELPSIPARLQDFIMNDLSRWYITLIRDWVDPNEDDAVRYPTLAVLWYVLYRLCLVMAPVNPMITEDIYQKIFKEAFGKKAKKSIHLEKWPSVDESMIDSALEAEMEVARQMIEAVRSLKSEKGIKLRWPTKALMIVPKGELGELRLSNLIRDMSNVKTVAISTKEITGDSIASTEVPTAKLILDISDSVELQQERIVKDLLRNIQVWRKENKFQTGEQIHLQLASSNKFSRDALKAHQKSIQTRVSAPQLDLLEKFSAADGEWISHSFYLCLNGTCFAAIKENAADKIKAGNPGKCGYCEKEVTDKTLGLISVRFKKLA
jgi:isoleucyl-tRNA synthetase